MKRRFQQLDVFSRVALQGNPLAVVHGAQGLSDETMAAFARWTNLSETTFLLPPGDAGADYHVRIWTPHGELPFAGHPTLGSCHAWLSAGGQPREAGTVVQQCGVGLVRIRRTPRDGAAAGGARGGPHDGGERLAFAAPPRRRTGPLEPELLHTIVAALGLAGDDVVSHQWVDNGPGWCAVLLRDAARVLAVRPDWGRLGHVKLGLVGAHPGGHDAQYEVRALIGNGSSGYEDPVTGSLNASVAQWLIESGIAPPRYVAAQGAVLQRAGRVHVEHDGGQVWVGGDVTVCIEGEVDL
jgi:PhzF family phenazine biosynthesis protein